MLHSEQINEIAAALAKAQGVIKNPEKTRLNPHYKSRYADLADGLTVIRGPLSANGIAIVQATDITREGVILITRLVHTSGQYFECLYPVASASTDHQKLGAALTYAKRQALFSLVGVCGDDDLDGEDIKTSGNGKDDSPVTAGQVAELRDKLETVGGDEQRFLKYLKIGSLAVLPAGEFPRAMAALDAKRTQP